MTGSSSARSGSPPELSRAGTRPGIAIARLHRPALAGGCVGSPCSQLSGAWPRNRRFGGSAPRRRPAGCDIAPRRISVPWSSPARVDGQLVAAERRLFGRNREPEEIAATDGLIAVRRRKRRYSASALMPWPLSAPIGASVRRPGSRRGSTARLTRTVEINIVGDVVYRRRRFGARCCPASCR